VASLTIHISTRARSPPACGHGPPPPGKSRKNDSVSFPPPRLSHALREPNAYYSPGKIALLFGYFRATETAAPQHVPGGMVFTCLSHDIIRTRRRTRCSTDAPPVSHADQSDVRAFHEAFADIVSLFQHFTFTDILQHQIASTRGRFGTGEPAGPTGGTVRACPWLRGALRDAIGAIDQDNGTWKPRTPDPAAYQTTMTPHERGAILVAASSMRS